MSWHAFEESIIESSFSGLVSENSFHITVPLCIWLSFLAVPSLYFGEFGRSNGGYFDFLLIRRRLRFGFLTG